MTDSYTDKAEEIFDRLAAALKEAGITDEDLIEKACSFLEPVAFDLMQIGYSDGQHDEAQFRDWCEAEAAKAAHEVPDYPDPPVHPCSPLTIKP